MVAPTFSHPLEPPFPRWYDPNTSCIYHSGEIGHDMERCVAFKYKVQSLVDNRALKFTFGEEPNIESDCMA
ncbi:hypothetical protein PTKIN_Ptkin05aG0093100 [Pterospermum kingtungense]